MSDHDQEAFMDALMAEARRRFGAERTRALEPDLRTLAADLARVAAAPLIAEGEPGFYLTEA